MPTAESILSAATELANAFRWLAILWHVALAAMVIAFLRQRRPSQRLAGCLLVLPSISVGVLAWVSGNPFNGLMFAILTAVLVRAALWLPTTVVTRGSFDSTMAGAALVAFGWTYPHFVRTDTWITYLYASPFGILPCPTLAVVIGSTLLVGAFRSASWSLALSVAGVLYGWIGFFTLGVALDIGLLAGALLLGAATAADLTVRRVRATDDERTRCLPGDELIPAACGALTHAITIDGPPAAVWPWLVQMGAGSRAGWYSYDFLDNARQPSASRIVAELQHVGVGAVFPALPRATEGFIVLAFEPRRSLILGWPNPDGAPLVTWAFVLEPRPVDATRLIVRVRAGEGYRFHGLPWWLSQPVIRLLHFAMQRKQLLGITRRVERSGGAVREAA
jgi:hypothetical protein